MIQYILYTKIFIWKYKKIKDIMTKKSEKKRIDKRYIHNLILAFEKEGGGNIFFFEGRIPRLPPFYRGRNKNRVETYYFISNYQPDVWIQFVIDIYVQNHLPSYSPLSKRSPDFSNAINSSLKKHLIHTIIGCYLKKSNRNKFIISTFF